MSGPAFQAEGAARSKGWRQEEVTCCFQNCEDAGSPRIQNSARFHMREVGVAMNVTTPACRSVLGSCASACGSLADRREPTGNGDVKPPGLRRANQHLGIRSLPGEVEGRRG